MFFLIFFNFLLSLVYIVSKNVCLLTSPLFLSGVRLLPAALVFILFSRMSASLYVAFFKREWFSLVCAALGLLGGDAFRLAALKVIPASHAALLATTSPFVALVLSYFFLGESVTLRKIAALSIGVVGLVPLLYMKVSLAAEPLGYVMSYMIFLASIVSFVILGIYSKKLSQKGYPLSMMVGAYVLIAGLVACALSLMTDTWSGEFIMPLVEEYKKFLFLFVVQNLFCFYLYNALVKQYTVTIVSFAMLLMPLFTSAILWWYGIEHLENEFVFGFCMIALAFSILFSTRKKI